MKKQLIFLLCFVLIFTSCRSKTAVYNEEPPCIEEFIEECIEECTEEYKKPIAKIAVITSELSNLQANYGWITKLEKKFGSENIVVHFWPRFRLNSMLEETNSLINEIANNLEIKVLIINDTYYINDTDTANYVIDKLREKRSDIFIAFYDIRFTNVSANLILNVNRSAVYNIFPEKAQKLGADTLIYFYDHYLWTENCVEYVESDLHRFMREKCEKIGLRFVEFNIGGAIQCGSDYNEFMTETIPRLIEEYGRDIVLFGLDN